MDTRLKPNLRTYGLRHKINLRVVALLLIFACVVTPFTNWMIPMIYKNCKGVVYI